MTKSQLLDYAEDNNIPGVSGSMRKADIIETIENQQSTIIDNEK